MPVCVDLREAQCTDSFVVSRGNEDIQIERSCSFSTLPIIVRVLDAYLTNGISI